MRKAVPALIIALNDEESDVRRYAAIVLGRMRPAAKEVVPALSVALKDQAPVVRLEAVHALGWIGQDAADAVPALIDALRDQDTNIRCKAAIALGVIVVKDAREAVYWQSREFAYRRFYIARDKLGFARFRPWNVHDLKMDDSDGIASFSLKGIEVSAKAVMPSLISFLRDEDSVYRFAAAEALGRMGPEAKDGVAALIDVLKDQDARVRNNAVIALGLIGEGAKEAITALIDALKDQDSNVRLDAANALSLIAQKLFDAKSTEKLPQLRAAYEALKRHSDSEVRYQAATVKRTVDYFESLWWADLREGTIKLAREHFYIAGVVIAYLLLQLIWLLFFWCWPLRLLQVVALLGQTGAKLKIPWTDIPIPIKHALVFPLLHYRPRILDAWARHYLATAKDNFAGHPTVAQRKVYVAMPATINDQTYDSPSAAQLQSIFAKRKITALLVGEGGAGKTSLACQMANWAMSDESEERLCKTHRMLPVLIEGNLDARTDGKDALLEAIRGRLQDLIGEPKAIFEELLLELLRKRRVLVIVDSLSELNETTRKSVRPAQADFPVAALVVTSRLDEDLGGAAKIVIKPLRLKSDRLSTFMGRYLSQRGKRELFEDEEYFEACRRLSQIVGEREITVLIARTYVEQIIAAKEQSTDRDLPRNLPDLMLGSVKNLNDKVKDGKLETHQVISVAKLIAWECLKQTCRPTAAKRDDVLKALKDEANSETLLKYLETRLQLIQTTGVGADQIRFTLDPLAEYLAGFYLIEHCGENNLMWQEFLDKAQEQPGAPETIKGFLLAVRDCCVEKGNEYRVPEKINDELALLAGLDAETIKTAQRKQRVKRWAPDLESPETEERLAAAMVLGSIGPESKAAIYTLIKMLKDRESMLRGTAALVLGEIGIEAIEAVPALIDALKDDDEIVRWNVAQALGKIGPNAVTALIEALNDSAIVVSVHIVEALGLIGTEAKAAIPTLKELLSNSNQELRLEAEQALKQIDAGEMEKLNQ